MSRIWLGKGTLCDRLLADPSEILRLSGLTPDPWQAQALRSTSRRQLYLASRQVGKSQTASAKVLDVALTQPGSLSLILSPTLRQSGEFFRAKLLSLWNAMGNPERLKPPTQLTLELANGSRIVSLPENEEGIRSYSSVALLVIDEAARVADSLYAAVTPMLAVSQGTIIALTTPFGKRGWFFEEWQGATTDGRQLPNVWERFAVKAEQCPRLTPAFLAEELARKGKRLFEQEYNLSFVETLDSVFAQRDIDHMIAGGKRYGALPLD